MLCSPPMSLRDGVGRALAHSMRAYYMPLVAGVALTASAFMPWMLMGEQRLGGVPDVASLWVLGLGILAVVLAALSVITRKNSRHPLLLVGLAAFAIVLLSEQLMERSAEDQAWARSEARAIVVGGAAEAQPSPAMAPGGYLALAAATVITLFGLTMIVRVAGLYAVPDNDDDG